MPKRSHEEKILRYKEKLKKLEEKSNQNKRRRYRIIDSESDNSDDGINSEYTENTAPPLDATTIPDIADHAPPENLNGETVKSLHGNETTLQSDIPDLPLELLEALGEPLNEIAKYGEDIHPNLAHRWLPILCKGLPKDAREKILSQYLTPSLNPEIAAAMNNAGKIRDNQLLSHQDQLGSGITAINKAMTLLLSKEYDEVSIIKMLSDATRILSDLHYILTDNRIKVLMPLLDKSIIDIILNEERDDTLFGSGLQEKIKTARSIEKQGLSIKKVVNPVQRQHPSTSHQGNWTGPPRFPANRGGRMTPRAASAPTWRGTQAPPPRPPPATQPQRTRKPDYRKHRAPLRR